MVLLLQGDALLVTLAKNLSLNNILAAKFNIFDSSETKSFCIQVSFVFKYTFSLNTRQMVPIIGKTIILKPHKI